MTLLVEEAPRPAAQEDSFAGSSFQQSAKSRYAAAPEVELTTLYYSANLAKYNKVAWDSSQDPELNRHNASLPAYTETKTIKDDLGRGVEVTVERPARDVVVEACAHSTIRPGLGFSVYLIPESGRVVAATSTKPFAKIEGSGTSLFVDLSDEHPVAQGKDPVKLASWDGLLTASGREFLGKAGLPATTESLAAFL